MVVLKGALSRQRYVSIRAPKPIRCSRPIMPDHNCVATTFLLSSVHSWAVPFHLALAARTSFCFRGVSAVGYRSATWNLILSSRHRDRVAGLGRWDQQRERARQSNCIHVRVIQGIPVIMKQSARGLFYTRK